ncbi:hypothetical protein AURDEDRAFT_112824 [Auricularia subglabra TFB-10046 SS5]|nr:hypothetical protein AURDEDRAFT_112824 [Auricularia subglabra TFB-10046 SS5]
MTVCADRRSVKQALSVLRESPHLFVDCEGRDLGCAGGQLSVISVGTAFAEHVFLFDVLRLKRSALRPVVDLLRDDKQIKYVWDGRMDNIELQRAFGVPFGRTIDLQIADVLSRKIRAQEAKKHFDPWGVHSLVGLKNALEQHRILQDPDGEDDTIQVNHTEWMLRPLPPTYLQYAERDILLLAYIYTVFNSRSYISHRTDASRFATLLECSDRYINMHAGPLPKGNVYLSSNLLPLGILEDTAGVKQPCDCCDRWLLVRRAFKIGPVRHTSCKVCRILTERAAARQKRTSGSHAQSPVYTVSLPYHGGSPTALALDMDDEPVSPATTLAGLDDDDGFVKSVTTIAALDMDDKLPRVHHLDLWPPRPASALC